MEDEQQAPPVGKRIARWIDQRPGTTVVAGLLVVAIFIVAYWAFWPYRAPGGYGFAYYDTDTARMQYRTLWDWLGLLIVPAALAAGAYWLNRSQREAELKIAEQGREKDREIAEKAREKDREIAEKAQADEREATENARRVERQSAEISRRQATLEAYYDRMTELLLDRKLRESPIDSEVRSIVRSRTIAVVRSLDGERNGQLFTFLVASKLMEHDSPIIDLAQADLSNAVLSRANLSSVNLRHSDLTRADLSDANLSGANLNGAILTNANLSSAKLRDVKLDGAVLARANLFSALMMEIKVNVIDLSEADLRRANLRGAKLAKADLRGANLSEANLSGANLSGAVLEGGILIEANLIGADLSDANLSGAKLTGAILTEVNLEGAKNWTIDQFDQASLLDGTVMPDGEKLGGWSGVGPAYAEWKAQYLAKQGEAGA